MHPLISRRATIPTPRQTATQYHATQVALLCPNNPHTFLICIHFHVSTLDLHVMPPYLHPNTLQNTGGPPNDPSSVQRMRSRHALTHSFHTISHTSRHPHDASIHSTLCLVRACLKIRWPESRCKHGNLSRDLPIRPVILSVYLQF
jgi:hypothetical protein